MSIIEVLVPQLSESVAEASLLNWKKQPGQAVQADEILIEVETDKVVLEVPAPVAGVLSEIVKGTSLAAAIAYAELSYQASLLASTTYRPLETYTLIAVMYFVVITLLNQLAAFLERRLGLPGERA